MAQLVSLVLLSFVKSDEFEKETEHISLRENFKKVIIKKNKNITFVTFFIIDFLLVYMSGTEANNFWTLLVNPSRDTLLATKGYLN